MDAATATARETMARIQFSWAILTPAPASERPMRMMTGPITTGGKSFFIRSMPKVLTSRLISI